MKVDGLSHLEHGFEKFEKSKNGFFCGGNCGLGFWNTDLKNLRNLKKKFITNGTKGCW